MAQGEAQQNVVSRGLSFWGDSVQELKKVSFPTRQETVQATIIALFIIIFVSLCLFLLDVIFDRVMSALLA